MLKTRVTLGTIFFPSCTSGLTAVFLLPVFRFRGVEERFLQLDALAAEHNGADGNPLLFLVQVRESRRWSR